ncbi:MAG: hypothetical protein OXF98_03210, partial [Rhodospirillaceae bacterium]|nr:hypothetical protein [Rhodospirillaceae bacterium]
PVSRRATSLTVWMSLRAHGWNAVRDSVRENIRLTRVLEGELAAAGFRVLAGGELSVACARFEPRGLTGERLDALQADITRDLVASGATWFTTLEHVGALWMRFNLVNIYTRERHVRRLVGLLREAADRHAPGR